jgi:hypothetical protein
MRLANGWKCVMAMAICLILAGAATAGGKAFDKASKMVHGQQKVIAFFAHPTAKFNSIQYQSSAKCDGGFQLNYRLNYNGLFGIEYYSTLGFKFDFDGYLRSIDVVETSSIVDPFDFANAVLDQMRKDILNNNPDLRSNAVLREVINRSDAKTLLTFVLKTAK